MKILCVTPYYKPAYVYGGPAGSVSSLCKGMNKVGAEVTVYTTNANGPGNFLDVPIDRPLEIDGVEVHYFPLSWPLAKVLPFYSPALGQACRANIQRFDAVYIPGSWTYTVLAGARSALRAKIPYVVSPRGSLMDWPMSRGAFKKRLYLAVIERRLVDGAAAIHTTCFLEQQQIQKWGFRSRTVTIPNGIDLAPFVKLPQRGRLRHSLGIPLTGTLSLFVGRLHKTKRLALTIDAFATVARKRSEAHLLIVGPDEDGSAKAAQEQVRQLGLSSRVHFAGLLAGTDLIQAYVDSDMLILLSHLESFGMVVVEAMAAGLPVLLAKEVGLAGEVGQADAGLVVPATPDDAGAAWQRLLAGPGLRKAMGKRGMTFVRGQFAADVVAARMLGMFTSVSGRG